MTDSSEDAENWALISAPAGEIWSGRGRYAAAMYFYRQGILEADVLEIYRILSRLDDEDPAGMLQKTAVGRAWLEKLLNRQGQSKRQGHKPA